MRNWILYIPLTCCLISCAGNQTDNPDLRWDADTNTYTIISEKISYQLPTHDWIVVPEENLPEDLKFCAIDTANNICTMIINPFGNDNKPTVLLSKQKLDDFLSRLTTQDNAVSTLSVTPMLDRKIFKGKDTWHFRANLTALTPESETDTMHIVYSGLVFDGASRTCAIVITTSANSFDDVTEENIESYLNPLSFTSSGQ